MLPVSTVHDGGLALLPALFTATSSLCVTGLAIVDTATYWTTFGHAVMLALIQIGGFGVMSFATIIGLAVTRRTDFGANMLSAAEHGSDTGGVGALLKRIFATSLLIEGLVAGALAIRFLTLGYSVGTAIWHGVFHAVSAFNNAGFALYTLNLSGFVGDWWVYVPIMIAIILGGLGFPVLFQLRHDFRNPYRWTLNTRMVLVGTALLLVVSSSLITILEWNNPHTLGPLDTDTKVLAGAFQAVQTRTAGFNSIDIGSMHDSTLLAMDLFMFIGAGPAGTAGGIKITTAFVLVALVVAEIRGRKEVNLFGKSFVPGLYRQAVTVVTLSFLLLFTAVFAILVLDDFGLEAVLFEATSAFGTVGLSTGITGSLNAASQIILILLMIVGRLGPITVATALALTPNKSNLALPKERPIIG